MATTIGEFVFALGFGKPDTRNLDKARDAAVKATAEAQRKVREGAEDASEALDTASKKIDKLSRANKRELTGLSRAVETIGKAARKSAREFTSAWRDPEALTEQWSKALGRARSLVLGVAGATTGLAAGVGAMVSSTIESDTQLRNWSVRLGESVENLSRLEQAAKGFAEADDVREGIQTLRENLSELAGEGTGPALESLKDLGVELDDIRGKDAAEQFEILADAIERVDNERGIKAALELLGGEGGKLLPFLRQGADGIKRLAAEAEEMGTVVDGKAASASAELGREIGQVTSIVRSLIGELSRGMMPTVRGIVRQIRDWVDSNRDLIRQRVAEFLERIIPLIVELFDLAQRLAVGFMDLTESLGGLESALTIAAVAFGAVQVAALGIPGAVLAASAALAYGISELAGYSDELERLRGETAEIKRQSRKMEAGLEAFEELDQRRQDGTLGALSDDEYERMVEAAIGGSVVAGVSAEQSAGAISLIDGARDRALESKAEDEAIGRMLDPSSRENINTYYGSRIDRRIAKRRLGPGARNAAIAAAQAAAREGATPDQVEAAALGRLDAIAGVSKSKGKDKINTSAADDAFGAEIRRLAEREGLGDVAVRSSLEAGASSLKQGSTQGVARAAALGRLGSLAGKDFTPRDGGKDPLLSVLLGNDVPDIELSSIARGATPQVLISNIWNTFSFDMDTQIYESGDGRATGENVASMVRSFFQDSIAAATKTAKVKFQR